MSKRGRTGCGVGANHAGNVGAGLGGAWGCMRVQKEEFLGRWTMIKTEKFQEKKIRKQYGDPLIKF